MFFCVTTYLVDPTNVRVQVAEEYAGQAPNKEWWADYSWQSVYMGAAALMWNATSADRYRTQPSQC